MAEAGDGEIGRQGVWAGVVAFLEGGGLGEPVERIDTHGALVFLGRDRAWKLKRPVRFGFMDLSTPALREAATRAELALNRRTAPELYLGVVPVTREAVGGLALGGSGVPLEWLLEMRRFPAPMQLDHVAERGAMTPALLDCLAEVIAGFHAGAERRPDHGGARAMRAVAEGNAADLAGLVPTPFMARPVTDLVQATAIELDRRAALLDRRRAAGAVRRCHGDLHLANIVLLDGRPTLFDCLEFSEELASIDVLYDLAFLVMDLLDRGMRHEAWQLLQAYGDRCPEDEGLALMPLFISVRAAVRAKIMGFTATAPGAAGDHARLLDRGRAYLALARAALEPVPAVLIAIGGRSGTGKSTLAAAIAPAIGAMPGAVLLRSDVIRKRMLGHAPTARLPAEDYAPAVSRRVYRHMAERAAVLLRAGRAVVCDAVHAGEAERAAIAAVATRHGAAFHGFWLEAPEAVLEARVAARRNDASDADTTVVRGQRRLEGCEARGWHRLRADRPRDALVAEVLALHRVATEENEP